VKSLRALRALKPLRMVSRNPGMKAVVNCIIGAIPAIADVMLVMMLFLIIFAIMGVQLLKGKFYRCSCQDWCPEKRLNPQAHFSSPRPWGEFCEGPCLESPTNMTCVWGRHPDWSFDNSARAVLTLFEVSTLEMWPDVMFTAVDGVSPDEGPEYDRNPSTVLFFITFLFVTSFFILNLFVGVVIDKFTEVRNDMNGLTVLSEEQKRWISTQRRLLKVRPRLLLRPPGRWQQLALQMISTREFDATISCMIMLNILVMCGTHYGASEGIKRIQENANLVFLGIFTLEALLKLFALRLRLYFRDWWNVFDLAIVVGSVTAVLIEMIHGGEMPNASSLRVFRIARIVRLVKSTKSLRRLLETLILSVPSLVNVGAMLLLLFFVYAVAGMALFGDIQIAGNTELRIMNKDVNFGSFYLAMAMLFRMSTGESWNGIMHDCFSGARCEKDQSNDCGNTFFAVIFFVSFMLIGSFVFLNLFIAVIIEKLFEAENTSTVTEGVDVSEADVESFIECWAELAPDGDEYIPTAKLPQLLKLVAPPLGFKGEAVMGSHILRLMLKLGIRDHDGHVHFTETLWRLAAMVVGADMTEVADYEVAKNLDRQVIRILPVPLVDKRQHSTGSLQRIYLAGQVTAAVKVQSQWRRREVMRRLQRAVSLRLASEEACMKHDGNDGDEGVIEPTAWTSWGGASRGTPDLQSESFVRRSCGLPPVCQVSTAAFTEGPGKCGGPRVYSGRPPAAEPLGLEGENGITAWLDSCSCGVPNERQPLPKAACPCKQAPGHDETVGCSEELVVQYEAPRLGTFVPADEAEGLEP